MPLDSTLIGAIHLERLRRADARLDLPTPHVVFQTSTIDALLDGAYEGDLTFAELAAHGDLGLGTVQHLDGEMIALDGRFYRADASGMLHQLDPDDRTPFAVVVPFAPDDAVTLEAPLDLEGLARLVDERRRTPCVAFRLDGYFARLKLRTVPRQEPPYRPLAEVLVDQVECPQYEPRFAGGTWNHDLPPEEPLQGFQNTVTNCGYLILATRLSLLDPSPSGPYLPKSNAQSEFLEQWFSATSPADPLLYAFAPPSPMVVARERVTAYASGEKVGGYEPARAWAGDQGLLVAGLVDRMRLPAGADELARCENLIVGAITYLADKTTGALKAWRPDVPGDFRDDYLTGIAVFMRCLLYAYQQNGSLRTFLEQEKFQAFVRTNADLVVESPHSESADALVNRTNDLATLVAAIRMLS